MINLEDRLYTTAEAANLIGTSLRSVYRYVKEGKLAAETKTAAGTLRFTKKAILAFLYPHQEPEEPSVRGKPPTPAKKAVEPRTTAASLPRAKPAAKPLSPLPQSSPPQPSPVIPSPPPKDSPPEAISRGPGVVPEFHYYQLLNTDFDGVKTALQKQSQRLKKPYALTLLAGFSLYQKLSEPKAIVHAYVNRADLADWEEALNIAKSNYDQANLGLITRDTAALASVQTINDHPVVSPEKLINDLNDYSMDTRRLASKLRFKPD